MTASGPYRWIYPTPKGLYCEPGNFYIDPAQQVEHALITHGHSDHARPGHGHVLTTRETGEIMKIRFGAEAAGRLSEATLGKTMAVNDVKVRFAPAGHILGSAQIAIEHKGCCAVISGDYKRTADPTCLPFETMKCDLFITEATFGLPVFCHEPPDKEVARLLGSLAANPDRVHLLGVYGLGKCQRMIVMLRKAGYDAPIFLHGALVGLCSLYERLGVNLGDLQPVREREPKRYQGALVMCPPSAIADRWARRFGDALSCFASGWMRVRGRARQRGAELPLVISDHADWPELLDTIQETQASEVWVTHGREDALVHQLGLMGLKARALALVGFEDEDD
ncbi:MAG TPA: ligase-associated DNA damage response exonuclease [Aestuariivirgaceae bacterium]|jgi:putative mRNA 3-end processing factor|nr:ligase-associated DNA damage response exonuclease [Aestuariivirgaceae bacterium]